MSEGRSKSNIPMKKRARLKDIANALNLSITTVSRALNDKPDISQKTKEAVRKVADMLDYRPNYFARFLHQESNNLIGVVVPRINHAFFSTMINGIVKKAQDEGYFVMLGESFDDFETEEYIYKQFIDLGVDGLIVSPAYHSKLLEGKDELKLRQENIVLLDRYAEKLNYNQITNDHSQGAKQAIDHLYEQGYKKIAHIKGLTEDNVADEISQGYEAAIKDQEPLIYECDHVTPEEGYVAMQVLMDEHQPDAIFAISDEAAMGVYRYCYKHKLRIPEDIGLIGYSNAPFGAYLAPALTTVAQMSSEMGETAVDMLIERKGQESPTASTKKFVSELIIRESSIRKK